MPQMGRTTEQLTDRTCGHLSEVLEGELVAGLGQLLDDLSDSVSWQRQVSSSEQLIELVLTDEPVVVHVWRRRGQRSNSGTRLSYRRPIIFIQTWFILKLFFLLNSVGQTDPRLSWDQFGLRTATFSSSTFKYSDF